MAFYQPSSSGVPQAPIVGGAQSLAATEIANQQPAFNAADSMMNAMTASSKWEEMKTIKREKGTTRADQWLQSELYNMLNPDDDVYNYMSDQNAFDFNAMKDNRKFHDLNKETLRIAYENKVKEYGGLYNIATFGEAWKLSKEQENSKILAEMYLDVKQGHVNKYDFQMAARNENFLDFYKDLSDEQKTNLQTNARYDPGWRTYTEAFKAAPGEAFDWAYDSPGKALGAATTVGLGVPVTGLAANWALVLKMSSKKHRISLIRIKVIENGDIIQGQEKVD